MELFLLEGESLGESLRTEGEVVLRDRLVGRQDGRDQKGSLSNMQCPK